MEEKVGVLAILTAKPGKEQAVADFLTSALPLAIAETDTVSWYAIQLDGQTFGIFDTFPHDEGRQKHLSGQIATALMANASDLLATAPDIKTITVLAAK